MRTCGWRSTKITLKKIRKKYMIKTVYFVFLAIFILASSGSAIQYTYDNMNRLLRVEYDNGSAIEYYYDGAGNRTQRIITAPPCYEGLGYDGDIDGSDLASYIAGGSFTDIAVFAASYGRANCP